MADVLTWMWQGMLVAAALAGVLCAAPARRMTSATRYWICWLGLVVVLVLPLVPILLGAMSAAGAGAAAASGAALTLPSAPPVLVVSAVAAWALTVAGALGRLALDMRRLRRMKGRARPMPEARQRRLPLWQDVRDRGRRTELAVLDGPITAAVLGFRRPMVVVPGALLDTLTDPELDQVVAHEQAHVERRDDWANLLQRIIAVPFGLHPAVWLINRWIRRERELAADEWVALRTGAPRAYARCLARVAETLAWPEAPRLASGAVGSGGAVARRVAHLLDGRRVRARRPSPWVLGSATVLSAIVAFLLGGSTPAVELGAGGAAATRVRVGPPASSSHRVLAVLGVPAGRTRTGSQARVAGIGLPARRAPEPLAAIQLFGRQGPLRLQPAARSNGIGLQLRTGVPLPARDLGLSAHRALAAPVEEIAGTRESRWAWAERAGTSLGSWFAEAGQTTGGAFRGLGTSLTRTFTGRR